MNESQLNQNAFFVFYISCSVFWTKDEFGYVSLPVRMEMQEKYFLAKNIKKIWYEKLNEALKSIIFSLRCSVSKFEKKSYFLATII